MRVELPEQYPLDPPSIRFVNMVSYLSVMYLKYNYLSGQLWHLQVLPVKSQLCAVMIFSKTSIKIISYYNMNV